MRTEDDQWVVQDAATQAIASLQKTEPRLPNKLPPLTETPWLIEYAGELGIGVVPGKPALDLLYKALKEGADWQQLSALHYLTYHGDETALVPIYEIYFSMTGEIREAALNTLWHLSAAGLALPPPIQYGLK